MVALSVNLPAISLFILIKILDQSTSNPIHALENQEIRLSQITNMHLKWNNMKFRVALINFIQSDTV